MRTFDFNYYSKVSSHIKDLKKYAWKPIIIQEVLQEFKTVLYVDSSIKFISNNISSVLCTIKDIGSMARQLIGFKLPCFTDSKMFKWFKESTNDYEKIDSIEASLTYFENNFITEMIMKAWVTCALDENCMAPKGSRLRNLNTSCLSCGCKLIF